MRPTYNFNRPYEWNYENGPDFEDEIPSNISLNEASVRLLDLELAFPLGIPAGLLLNARWVELYARMGFDLLTYKTVRTRRHPSLPPPNCLFVDTKGQLTPERFSEKLVAQGKAVGCRLKTEGEQEEKPSASSFLQPNSLQPSAYSITNSFGMPSQDPREWQPDVERAKGCLGRGQVLVVSVVGTFLEEEGVDPFIKDFARCARLAAEAGADIVELNLSCPNSCAREGVLYTDPALAGRIVRSAKREIGDLPLFIKVGFYLDPRVMEALVSAVVPFVQGIVGINTLKMEVIGPDGRPALPGEGRQESGICGAGIQECGLRFIEDLTALRRREKYDFAIVGVGGVFSPQDMNAYLKLGVDAVQTCTGAMFDPYLAAACRNEDRLKAEGEKKFPFHLPSA